MVLVAAPVQAGTGSVVGGSYASVLAAGYGHHSRLSRHEHRRHAHGHYRHDGFRHDRYGRDFGRHHRWPHHRGHHRSRSSGSDYLLGGIVLGSILGHTRSGASSHPPSRSVHYERIVVAPDVRRTRVIEPEITRRLYRDLDGNCFERQRDGAGRELLVELPEAECAW